MDSRVAVELAEQLEAIAKIRTEMEEEEKKTLKN